MSEISMAALQFGGLHTTCSSCPFPTIEAKFCRLSTSHAFGDCIAVVERCTKFKWQKLTKNTAFPIQNHSCSIRTKTYTLKAAAFQAVAAGHDSEGSDMAAPSAKCTNLMLEFQTKKLRSLLLSTSETLQGYARTLSKPAISEVFKIFIQGLQSKLHALRTEKCVPLLENSEIDMRWKRTEPWISWPVAIFVTLCLMTTLIFGLGATTELIPLWIMGPLTTGLCIKTIYETIKFINQIVAKTSGYQLVIREKSCQLYEDARTGNLPAQITSAGASKLKEFKMIIAIKKELVVVYFQSGQTYSDFLILLRQLSDHTTGSYEDWKEWIRPSLRRFTRFLQKVF